MAPNGKGKDVADCSGRESVLARRASNWNAMQDRILVQCMLEARDKNQWSEKTFTTAGWNGIVQQFNELAGLRFAKDQIQSRWKIFKMGHSAYLTLRNKSGWGWDNLANRPIAPDDLAWLELPNALRKYKRHPFLYFEEVLYIIGSDTATGRYASSSRATMASRGIDKEIIDQNNDVQSDGDDADEVPTPPVTTYAKQRSSGSKRRKSSGGDPSPNMEHVMDMIHEMIGAQRRKEDEDARDAYRELREAFPTLPPAAYIKLADTLAQPSRRELFHAVKDDPEYLQVVKMEEQLYNPFEEILSEAIELSYAMAMYLFAEASRERENPRLPILLNIRPWTGRMWIDDMMAGHVKRSYRCFRMKPHTLMKFVELLEQHTGLANTRRMDTIEQVCIFLFAFGHAQPNRILQEWFWHSGSTISAHTHRVLQKILLLEDLLIRLPTTETPRRITSDHRYAPYFQGVIGAIDGTHIKATVPAGQEAAYRNRKNCISQNVMAAASFDFLFTYILAGWEGSASYMSVLRDAIDRRGFIIPEGCMYLVDCGCTNTDSFITPYRGIVYHLPEWRALDKSDRYISHKHLFNHRHSKLRSDVERTFGVWKKRFKCFTSMPTYAFETLRDIVKATTIIHNFIKLYGSDKWFDRVEKYLVPEPPELEAEPGLEVRVTRTEMQRGERQCDTMAHAMYNDRMAQMRET